jgi:hypothetical protein
MRKITCIFSLLVLFISVSSCELLEKDVTTSSVSDKMVEMGYLDIKAPKVVKNQYSPYSGQANGRIDSKSNDNYNYLEFATLVDFQAFVGKSSNEVVLKEWKNTYKNFYSLEDEVNMVFSAYDNLLNQVENNYPKIELITPDIEARVDKNIDDLLAPYSTFIVYTKEQGIERKTYSISNDYLLNKDGIVKIGEDIYQFSTEIVKMIKGGDISKISSLSSINHTNESLGIYVFPVYRDNGKSNGRTEQFYSISSCESEKSGSRLIAYEERLRLYNSFLAQVIIQYQIKLRSLEKRGLWWGNKDTGLLDTKGSYYAAFNPANTPTVTYDMPPYSGLKHTHSHMLVSVTAFAPSVASALASAEIFSSNHTASGREGTTCNFGVR